MLDLNDNYIRYNIAGTLEPRIVIRIDFDSDLVSDPVYILSHSDADYPLGATVISSRIISASSVSQQLKEISSIGSINIECLDSGEAFTTKLYNELAANKGLPLKRIRAFHGYLGLDFDDYIPVATTVVGSLSYKDGVYSLSSNDVQRISKDFKLFPEIYTNLYATIGDVEETETASTGTTTQITLKSGSATASYYVGWYVIPTEGAYDGQEKTVTAYNESTKLLTVSGGWGAALGADINITLRPKIVRVNDNSVFTLLQHGDSYTDATSREVFYTKIDEEVIRFSSVASDGTSDYLIIDYQSESDSGRGALETEISSHEVDVSVSIDRRQKVTDYIYVEMPAVKLLYAIFLNVLYGSADVFSYGMGIDTDYITTTDFTGIGDDIWNPNDDTQGVMCRFIGIQNISAKQFIEKELLPLIGCWMPIYADGSFGLKRRAAIVGSASTLEVLNESNIINFSNLKYNFDNLRNKFKIKYHHSDLIDDFKLNETLIYTDSITKFFPSELEEVSYRGMYANSYNVETIANIVDLWADRRVYPQWELSVDCFGSMSHLEVGDVVKVDLPQLMDLTTNATFNRAMEIIGKNYDFVGGEVSFQLQGSSSSVPAYSTYSTGTVLPDAYYTSTGVSLATAVGAALSGNTIISNCTIDAATHPIVYHNNNLTINSGVIVTFKGSPTLKIKGIRTLNGKYDGKGWGDAGGTGVYGQEVISDRKVNTWGYSRSGDGFADFEFNTSTENDIYFKLQPGQYLLGKNSSDANFNILYDGTDLLGLPSEVRGTGGPAGSGVIDGGVNKKLGGDGGNGGAGLIEIARGFIDGINAEYDFSGNVGSAGLKYDTTYISYTHSMYSGAGGPGMPGFYLAVVDGPTVDIPDKLNITMNSGNIVTPAASYNIYDSISEWGYVDSGGYSGMYHLVDRYNPLYAELATVSSNSNKSYVDSHFKVVYIKDNNAKEAPPEDSNPSSPISFGTITSSDADLLTLQDGTQITRINVNWTPTTDPQVIYYEIYYRQANDQNFTYIADRPKRSQSQAYIYPVYDGGRYTIFIRSVNKFGVKSDAISTIHTVIGKTAAPSVPTSVTATAGINSILIDGTSPANNDLSGIEIWRHTANVFGSATLVETVAALPSKKFGYKDIVDPGLSYYYWARSVDNSRIPSTEVAATGNPRTALSPKYTDGTSIDDLQPLEAGSDVTQNAFITGVDLASQDVIADGLDAYANVSEYYHTYFESIDSLSLLVGGANSDIYLSAGNLVMHCDKTAGDYASLLITKSYTISDSLFLWNRPRSFKIRLYHSTVTNFTFSFGFGSVSNTGSTARIAFRVDSGTIKSTVANGSGSTTSGSIGTVTSGNDYLYEVIFDPGVDVKFYVDNTLADTVTTSLPSAGADPYFFVAYLTCDTTTGSEASIRTGELKVTIS